MARLPDLEFSVHQHMRQQAPLAVSVAVFASAQERPMNSELELGPGQARQGRRDHILQAFQTLANPLVGLIMVGTGGALLAAAGSEEKLLQSELQKQLSQLQACWPRGTAR